MDFLGVKEAFLVIIHFSDEPESFSLKELELEGSGAWRRCRIDGDTFVET